MANEKGHLHQTGDFPGKACDPRRLNIDFEAYTEGDDDYKKELVGLIIQNLKEFRQSLLDSAGPQGAAAFLKASHKAKVILGMLDDPELSKVVAALEKEIAKADRHPTFSQDAARFQTLCDSIIKALEMEINNG